MRKQVSELLNNSSTRLGSLIARAQQVNCLQKLFSHSLPSNLKESGIEFASAVNGVISVIVPNALVANQIRMTQHEILQHLRQIPEFEFIYQIKPKVRPQVERPKQQRQVNPISKQNAELLLQEARHCEDVELRKILESLATHTK